MGSTDPQICFEGPLVKVTRSRNTQNLWCTLDGECLAFYRNRRSSCMFTIEINRVKSVTPFLDKNQFEVITERSFLFSAETAELCQDWINHIEEARQQDGQLVITSQKQENQSVSPRRGSLPQHNAVSNALKRLSGQSDKSDSDSSNLPTTETKEERESTTKDMINRFSSGVLPKQTVCSPSRPFRPNSGGNVNSLLLRFSSAEGSGQSPTSPVSPTSYVRPFSDRPISSNIPKEPSYNLPVRPLSVGHQSTQQEMTGITTTSTRTKIDLSEVSSEAIVVESSQDRHTDSGYTSSICSSPPKEPQHNIDLHMVNSEEVCETKEIHEESTEERVVLRSYGNIDQDNIMRRRTDKVEEEEDDEDEESEQAGPDLQLLDDLMSLTFEEIENPQSSPVDLSALTELKGLLTDLPPSLLMRRSVDVNNQAPVEELRQFLQTAQ